MLGRLECIVSQRPEPLTLSGGAAELLVSGIEVRAGACSLHTAHFPPRFPPTSL